MTKRSVRCALRCILPTALAEQVAIDGTRTVILDAIGGQADDGVRRLPELMAARVASRSAIEVVPAGVLVAF